MYLQKDLLSKRINDADLRLSAEASYDAERIRAKTEFVGGAIVDSADITAAAAAGSVDVKPFTIAYLLKKVATISLANGTVIANGALDFDIEATGCVTRNGVSGGKVIVDLIGSTADTIASFEVSSSPNVVSKFIFSVAAQALGAGETVKLQIRRTDTSIAESFKVTDVALTIESVS